MELDENQLRYISMLVSNGEPISRILSEEFPDAGITIVKKPGPCAATIYGAYLAQKHASKAMAGIPAGEYPDNQDILVVSARDLIQGLVCIDRKKDELIGGFNKRVVCSYLEAEALKIAALYR